MNDEGSREGANDAKRNQMNQKVPNVEEISAIVVDAAPLHSKQLLTYLRLMQLPLGLLVNFGAATFKEGIKRIVNNHTAFASSRLRVNQGQ